MRTASKSLVLLAVLIPVGVVVPRPRFYINTTDSLPRGIYRETKERIDKGTLVVECLPQELAEFGRERGYLTIGNCPGHTVSVLKQVVGIPGSTIELADEYVAVDHKLIFISATLKTDREGREMPRVERRTFTLGPDEYFLLAPNPRSWDGRYTGETQRQNIQATVRPLLTEGEE